ncbi:hypothetical protein ASF35_16390 [Aeromicrobium sp. Leaf291]|nr:hypothetical protein ASF35_16390 [Aeromicrobium sp. Leaf291]
MRRPLYIPTPILGLDDVELRVLDGRAWYRARPAVVALQEWMYVHGLSLAEVPIDGVVLRHPDEGAVSATQVVRDAQARMLVDRYPGEQPRARSELVRRDGLDEVLPWPDAVLELPRVPPRRLT